MAHSGAGKGAIRNLVSARFGYDLQRSVGNIRLGYAFEVDFQRSVSEASVAFWRVPISFQLSALRFHLGGR